MFVQLVVSTLILGSVIAVPPTIAPPTDPSLEGVNKISAAAMTHFRRTVMDYEEHVKIFMDNLKVKGQSLKNATGRMFFEEMRPYLASLPKVETRLVTKRIRERCWCDGEITTPCPEKCIDSCHWTTDEQTFPWMNDNNCTGKISKMTECSCYEGSSTRCDYGALSDCYEGTITEEQKVKTTCSEHSIEEDRFEIFFSRFVELLLEPLRKQLRELEYKLSTLKQSVVATDLLFKFTTASCNELNETPCNPEAANILEPKLIKLALLKKNITMDMIRLQEEVESVSNTLAEQKEDAIFHLQEPIKTYACCLKGLNFTIKGSECEAPASSHSTRTSPRRPSPPTPTKS